MSAGTIPVLAIVPSLLTSLAFLSGCLVGDDEGSAQDDDARPDGNQTATPPFADATGSGAGMGTGNASGTETGPEPGNETANGTGTPPTADPADIENNTTPANVTFQIDATEPDGDRLDWTLEWDGNGSVGQGDPVPATMNVTYEEEGDHTVVLTVTDKDGSDTATVNLTVADGTAGP